ncbi:hypothetical protein FITA111629_00385 [Filibacter tadaridae]|uniref:Uncharacterized protein n=1 Tax=Filibacter tadaridae TaxID=2483811 RepID=A0A3P5XME5_9BACL|nr:hypothetical protein [Filibacter tadaridae]VDC28966.1 hypothetical protein FILTAD_01926 [Filibacter tadaridae]
MKTKITVVNGEVYILDGHPLDYMKLVGGLGRAKKTTLEVAPGKTIKMRDIVTFQEVQN